MRKIFFAALAALSLVTRSAWAEDAYEDAAARAAEAARRGDHAGAARTLDAVVDAYPQDYAVALSSAWQHFQAGEISAAERRYRAASERAPSSKDARVGLAWALARLGRCDDAAAEADRADDPRADGVRASCSPAPSYAIGVAGLTTLTPSHPIRGVGAGVVASLSAPLAETGTLGVAWRYLRVASSAVSSFDQHDVYVHGGAWGERWGFVARGAALFDGSGKFGTSGHGGFSAHLRLASWLPAWTGDLRLEAAFSKYTDASIVRVAPAWAVHAVGPLHVIPGFAVQHDGTTAYATGMLSALLAWPRVSAWGGAKLGEEVRPAYLAQSVVYDLTERIAWGAWAGLRVRASSALAIEATYTLDQLRRTDALTPARSAMHTLSLGPVITF